MDILCPYRFAKWPHVTMHINLSPEMEHYIKGKVASGFYGNATEVIRDAFWGISSRCPRARSSVACLRANHHRTKIVRWSVPEI
jgi:putative addiction module CopG family antidote